MAKLVRVLLLAAVVCAAAMVPSSASGSSHVRVVKQKLDAWYELHGSRVVLRAAVYAPTIRFRDLRELDRLRTAYRPHGVTAVIAGDRYRLMWQREQMPEFFFLFASEPVKVNRTAVRGGKIRAEIRWRTTATGARSFKSRLGRRAAEPLHPGTATDKVAG